ncbi:CBS domain-containing protein [Blastopirellula marina]|nr:CBS domain-containing protein [Blastopirellula marina]
MGVYMLLGSMAAFGPEISPTISVAVLSLAVGVLVGYLLSGRWRSGAEGNKPSQKLGDARRSSLYEKRQAILRRLQGDLDMLLENQIEVRNLMSTQVVRVQPRRTVAEMRNMMSVQHMRHLVVVDETERPIGVISDRDLLAVKDGVAADVMHSPVMAISPQSMLLPTVSHMIENKISCLPVVEDDLLVGIITTTDLLLTLQSILRLMQTENISRSGPSFADELQDSCII